jgi:CheY-like chemotaxis protein/predicted Ser/Thr protein kinase
MDCILVVDDHIEILEMLAEAFVMKGYQVITCNKPINAMEKIKKHRPQLIILDIQMPGMTGRDLVLALKQYDESIPVIIHSAKVGMKDDIEFKLSKNVRAFVPKPSDVQTLLAAIHTILPRSFSLEQFCIGNYRNVLGQTLGNCVLEEILGIGGTGVVYRGIHQGLKIPVAIKILSPTFSSDQESIRRFLREGRVLATMDHPNIVQVFNVDNQNGVYFLVMRYIKGKSLFRLIHEEGKLDLIRAGNIILKVARGLAVAHEQTILHRDVKPSNILVAEGEKVVKIIDFGLACPVKKEEEITLEGIALGTPGYMSPEQCLGKPLDARTDIYSLGATFYQAIAGQALFEGNSIAKLMAQLQGQFLDVHVLDKEIPVEVSQIINKMIAKEAEDRYPNMLSVILDLEKVIPQV